MKKLDQKAILLYLKANKKVLKSKFGVTNIALFGSFARDEADEQSDVDLLMKCDFVCIDNLYHLQVHLEQAFGRKVDIAHFNSVRKFYRKRIEKDIIYP